MKARRVLPLSLLALLSAPAHAQGDYMPSYAVQFIAIPTQQWGNINYQSQTNEMRNRLMRSNTENNNMGDKVKTDQAILATLTYKTSKKVSDKITDVMLTALGVSVHKTLVQIKTEIVQGGNQPLPPGLINGFLEKRGYPINNMASYFNVFLSISFSTLEGKPLSSAQEKIIYDRMLPVVSVFGKLNDAQKQTFSEYLAWHAQLQFYQNKSNSKAAKQAALRILGEFGFDQAMLEQFAKMKAL